jgi:hypothetical protein
MIDRAHDLPITKQAKALKHQPWRNLLPAAPLAGSFSADFPDDPAASFPP